MACPGGPRVGQSQYRRMKAATDSAPRQRWYRRWTVEPWLVFGAGSVLLLLAAGPATGGVLAAARDAVPDGVLATLPELAAGIGLGVLLSVVLPLLRRGGETPFVGDIEALLPRNRAELRLGAALAVTTGVTEKLVDG